MTEELEDIKAFYECLVGRLKIGECAIPNPEKTIQKAGEDVLVCIAEIERLEKENEATELLRKYVDKLIEVKDRKIMLELLSEMKTVYQVASGDFIPIQHYESIKEKESTITELQRVCDCAKEVIKNGHEKGVEVRGDFDKTVDYWAIIPTPLYLKLKQAIAKAEEK